jgi:hypothetical protein
MGAAMNRRRQKAASQRAFFADRDTRALSVAIPVFAYIWRYSLEISTNANRLLSDGATRDRDQTGPQL